MILVTGHHGLVGSALMHSLKGSRVGLEKAKTPGEWHSALDTLLRQHTFKTVIHAGAISDNRYKNADIFDWNVRCTATLARLCAERGIHFIFFSSQIARNPHTLYAMTKASAELYIIQIPNLRACILQPFNIWGDDESMKPVQCRSLPYRLATRELQVLWDTRRDYVHVLDVVRAVQVAIKQQSIGTYHVGTASPVHSFDLVAHTDYKGYTKAARPPEVEEFTCADSLQFLPGWSPEIDVCGYTSRINPF